MILRATLALLLALPQATLQESIEVRLHTVDVVVTDDAGKPVSGLRAEDFELLEDDKPQTITNFSAFDASIAATTANVASADAPATVAPPPPRTLVFFIDDLALLPRTLDPLAKNVEAFVQQMRDGDRAAVIGPGDTTLRFSSDRDEIAAQIRKRFEHASMTGIGVGFEKDVFWFSRDLRMMTTIEGRRQIARRWAAKTRDRVRQQLGTMRGIITTIAPAQGRKALITVTQSLQSVPGRELFYYYLNEETQRKITTVPEPMDSISLPPSREPDRNAFARQENERNSDLIDFDGAIHDVARLASTSGVALYMIRPDFDLSLRAGSMNVTESSATSASPQAPDLGSGTMLQSAIANSSRAIKPLVDISGGRQYMPNDKTSDAMQQIATDLSSYYSLAYHGSGGIDQPHKVEVRVRSRPQLHVRARNEVERKSADRELTDQVVASLIRGRGRNDLGIGVRAEPKKSKKDSTLAIDVLIPIGALDFERVGDTYHARYSAHYAVSSANNEFVSGVDADRPIDIPARDFEEARASHWTHTITVKGVTEQSRVAVGVMDLRTERSGIATMSVSQASSNPTEKSK